ncbi:MAG: hypothetical protein ACRD29_20420 [Acidimicrobiales bacterium]
MPTPTFTEITEQYGEAVTKSQRAVFDAAESLADLARDNLNVPSFTEPPAPTDLIEAALAHAQRVLDIQRAALTGVAEAWQPVVEKATADVASFTERLVGNGVES